MVFILGKLPHITNEVDTTGVNITPTIQRLICDYNLFVSDVTSVMLKLNNNSQDKCLILENKNTVENTFQTENHQYGPKRPCFAVVTSNACFALGYRPTAKTEVFPTIPM